MVWGEDWGVDFERGRIRIGKGKDIGGVVEGKLRGGVKRVWVSMRDWGKY